MLTVPCPARPGQSPGTPATPAIAGAVAIETASVASLESGTPSGPMARWVRVLEAFAESGEWGIRDLARATDIPRSAAHRILHDMAALGLLAPADEPGRFRVGADLARIGLLVAEHLDIRRDRPALHRARLGGHRRDGRHRRLRPPTPPVLGRRRRRNEPSHPLPLGIAPGLERPPPRLVRQGHPRVPAARRAGGHHRPIAGPDPRTHRADEGAAPRRSWQRRESGATSSATESASRARSVSRPRSATPVAGSSATSSRRGRTTAPTPTRRQRPASSSGPPPTTCRDASAGPGTVRPTERAARDGTAMRD